MLTILPRKIPNLHDLASKLLGKTVFVSWPHMREALVIGVSSLQRKITLVNKNKEYSPDNVWIEDLSTRSHWFTDCSTVADGYVKKFHFKTFAKAKNIFKRFFVCLTKDFLIRLF